MVKKPTVTAAPEVVDSVEAFEAKLAQVREAQKVFATYTQEQVDEIFYQAAMAANKARIPLAKLAVEETAAVCSRTRSSRTTMPPSTSTTPTRTPRPAASSSTTNLRHHQGGRAHRHRRRGNPHHQPHLHRDLQVPHLPEDPQRHHHLPAPGGCPVHHRRRQARA